MTPAAVTGLAIWVPTIAPVLGATPRKLAPIRRNADRFSSATRTFRSTCCEPGRRIRLITWGGAIVAWTLPGGFDSGAAAPRGWAAVPGEFVAAGACPRAAGAGGGMFWSASYALRKPPGV